MNSLMLAVVLLGFGPAVVYELSHKRDGRWAFLIGAAGAVIAWLIML